MIKYTATVGNMSFSVEGSVEELQYFLEKAGVLPKKEYPYASPPHKSVPMENYSREVYGPATSNTDTLEENRLRAGSKIMVEEIVNDLYYYEKDDVKVGTVLTIIQDDGDVTPKVDHSVEFICLCDLKWSIVEY